MDIENVIYLDSAATTRIDDAVLEEMMPFLSDSYGNPSSVHRLGRQAKHAVEQARRKIADVLAVRPSEIVFTGSGTEANNLALASLRVHGLPSRLLASAVEHESILSPSKALSEDGYVLELIPPQADGSVRVEEIEEILRGQPALVTTMTVNNETGALNNIVTIADCVHSVGGILHTDAVQAAAYYALPDLTAPSDMLTLSAHKIGGPKGVGLLYVRSGITPSELVRGGGQELGRRSGTENVAGIVGFARALELVGERRYFSSQHVRGLRRVLEEFLTVRLPGTTRVITPRSESKSAPHILHMIFFDKEGVGLDGEMLVLGMDLAGVQVSTGSACGSGAVEVSHVLRALSIPDETARGAIRFSLLTRHSEHEIRKAAAHIVDVVKRVGGTGS